MLVGGHVSVAGGIEKAPQRGNDIGANVIQIFGSSPRSFKPNAYTTDQLDRCKRNAEAFGIKQIYFHGVYLINLAHPNPDYRETSIRSVLQYLEISHAIGGRGVIFHPGFLQGIAQKDALAHVIHSCQYIIEQMPQDQLLIIENSAGASGSICSLLEDLALVADGVGSDRLAFCLDTQHTFATGFDVRTLAGINDLVRQFDQLVGWQKIVVIHCNDSKTDCGSHRDRHENIGQGKIGLAGLKQLVNHPKFTALPMILEVPGMDGKSGPDKTNIAIVKSLVNSDRAES